MAKDPWGLFPNFVRTIVVDSVLAVIICDKAILGLSSLNCSNNLLLAAGYFGPHTKDISHQSLWMMIVCLTLSLFWSPTLPSLVVDLYSLLFPCDATAAELMCRSVLAACCLRFQGRSHFHTHIMKTCIILTKEPKNGCKTRPGKQHKSKRHSWPLHEKFKLQLLSCGEDDFFLKLWWHWQRK